MSTQKTQPSNQKGFTLIELLIVVAILIALIIMGWFAWRTQLNKARDAQRKNHLERISVAFEDYYNDNECYPPSGIIYICNGPELEPYLYDIPCDPVYGTPYCYIPDPDNPDCGQTYKILAPLANSGDPIIQKLLCHGADSCGYDLVCEADTGTDTDYNYGVGSSNVAILNPETSPPPEGSPSPGSGSPSPMPSPSIYGVSPGYEGDLACDPSGVCNIYADPEGDGCPITFYDPGVCQTYCTQSPEHWCNR
jgi:prepilin-type N-terminal cleavage/methylation domain-containing protein